MRRACPRCATDPTRGLTPISQLPLVSSCPTHDCRLEPFFGDIGRLTGWEQRRDQPVPVDRHIVAMDRRTLEGFDNGALTLPRRTVHVGVWLRLLRSLLDELNTPTSLLRTRPRRLIEQVWQAAGRRTRNGEIAWLPYEAMPWPRQEAMLNAAATALHLLEAGTITGTGTLAGLLRAQHYQPADPGSPPVPPPPSRPIRGRPCTKR